MHKLNQPGKRTWSELDLFQPPEEKSLHALFSYCNMHYFFSFDFDAFGLKEGFHSMYPSQISLTILFVYIFVYSFMSFYVH